MLVNHYEILGVAEDADLIQISAAWKKLLTKFHPDRNPGDDSAKVQAVLINIAYDILSDPTKRLRFDKQLKQFRASRDDGGSTSKPDSASDEVESSTDDSTSTNQSDQFTDQQSDPFQVNPAQKPNRRVQTAFVTLIGIVLGGLTAVPIALYFAWLISGTDPFGFFGQPIERTAYQDVNGERVNENNATPNVRNDDGRNADGSNPDSVDSTVSKSKSIESGSSQTAGDQQPKSMPDEPGDGNAETDIAGDASPPTGNEKDQRPNINNEPSTAITTNSKHVVPPRLAIPDKDQVALAKQKIAEIFADEYESAISIKGYDKYVKLNDLSKQIIELQTHASDSAESYAIFEVAIDISRQSCFAVEALEIVTQFENKYEVDGFSIRMQHFEYWHDELPRAVRSSEAIETLYINLAKLARPFVDQIVENKKWELAYDFSRLVRRLYLRGGDRDSADKVVKAFPKLEWKRDEERKVNRFLKELAENPEQPDKQLAVGCYFCFVMDQWQQGLLHLKQSNHADLTSCVIKDLESAVATDKLAANELVGDLWWELANDDALKQYRNMIYSRAESHYLKALVDAKGITRAKLLERIRFVTPLPKITIVKASFGWNRKWTDATESLKKILEREPPDFLNSAGGLKVTDPIPHIRKVTKITYTIDGQQKNITLKAGPNRRYNLRDQLK
jgi:hypothetical protein